MKTENRKIRRNKKRQREKRKENELRVGCVGIGSGPRALLEVLGLVAARRDEA